jgi:antitoxin component YwqK of YwqJK toxin-antitoxin module
MKTFLKYYLPLITSFLYSCSDQKNVVYYPNGNIQSEVETYKGKRNGILKTFYESGKMKSKEEWRDGFLNGKAEYYFEDGKLKHVSNWIMNQQDGLTKKFYSKGELKSRSIYKMNQRMETVIYYENGNVQESQIYMGRDLPVYIVNFDSLGKEVNKILPPIFEAEGDTIKLGETYNVKITFGLPLRGEIKVYTGTYSSETGLSDTTTVLESATHIFRYSIKPDKSGKVTIPFFFGHMPEKEDTLSVDGQLTKHSFYVIDSGRII